MQVRVHVWEVRHFAGVCVCVVTRNRFCLQCPAWELALGQCWSCFQADHLFDGVSLVSFYPRELLATEVLINEIFKYNHELIPRGPDQRLSNLLITYE